ncbi:MAG: helix-turn-helix domain-containing protein [Bacteroidota bacterium]
MYFEINYYSGLLLPIVLQGMIYGCLMVGRGWKEQHLADRLLGFFLILSALRVTQWMLGFGTWYNNKDAQTQFMYYFPWDWTWFLGPLLYFYFRALTNSDFRIRGKHWWHFAIGSLLILGNLIAAVGDLVISQWWLGQELPYDRGSYGLIRDQGLGIVGDVLSVLAEPVSLVYWGYTYFLYRRYQRYVNDNFSETSDISFKWLGRFLPLMLVAFTLWLIRNLLLDLGWLSQDAYVTSWYFYLAWGVVIYYLSIQGHSAHTHLRQIINFRPAELSTPNLAEQSSSSTEELAEMQETAVRVEQFLEENPLYLEPDLNLKRLATALRLPASQISQAVNSVKGKNFNEFINAYRVRRVQELLASDKAEELSLLGIAFESGFNSKATFNRVFKQYTGKTPSQYLKVTTSGKSAEKGVLS